MREIKFRARFICGMCNKTYWLSFSAGQVMLLNHPDSGRAYSCEKGGWCDQHQTGEIVQYADQKDESGKEVYEGDIIRALIMEPPSVVTMGEIVFDEAFAQWGNKNLSGITPLYKLSIIEVIGNIYETPGLL